MKDNKNLISWYHFPEFQSKEYYEFAGANGNVRWPTRNGCNLGSAGIWNFLWRLGIRPGSPVLSSKNSNILSIDGAIPAESLTKLKSMLETRGSWIIATGNVANLQNILPKGVHLEMCNSPYPAAALGWTGMPTSEDTQVIAPPSWSYFKVTGGEDKVEQFGKLVALGGDRVIPCRALRISLDAPALVRIGRLILLNGNPFAALQSWLQGQEDLEPWLHWRNPMFWLDEQIEFLANAVEFIGFPLPQGENNKVEGLSATNVVMRHDLDSSRDTSMLEFSKKIGQGASYAILQDGNRDFWVRTLEDIDKQEAAFHYDSLHTDTFFQFVARHFGWKPKTEYRPGFKSVAGQGLMKQIDEAKKFNIGVKTLHRHASFILYPELVDALDFVFSNEAQVLGASSYFRGQVLRWGVDRVDGSSGTIGHFPYPMFPYWMPFKLAHAADGGRLSRGFETTSIMECEPELVYQMLNYKSDILPQRIFTLSFHPYHSNRSSYNTEGMLVWFKEISEMLRKMKVPVTSLAEILKKCHVNCP